LVRDGGVESYDEPPSTVDAGGLRAEGDGVAPRSTSSLHLSDPPWDPPEPHQRSRYQPSSTSEIRIPEPPQFDPPHTSELTVTSLVLALLWIGGLGSLLAIFFAVAARQHLRDSGPWEGGEDLALAGLILGIVGLAGTAVLFGLIVNLEPADNSTFPPIKAEPIGMVAVAHYGQAVRVQADSNASPSHIASVTVLSLTLPVNSQVPYLQPAQGWEFAVAQVRICAGPRSINASNFPLSVYLLGHGQPIRDGRVKAGIPLAS